MAAHYVIIDLRWYRAANAIYFTWKDTNDDRGLDWTEAVEHKNKQIGLHMYVSKCKRAFS